MEQYDSSGKMVLDREDMGRFICETIYNDGFCTQRIPNELLKRKLDKIFSEFDARGKGHLNLREMFKFM